jgi:hypothetical protein
MTIETPAYFGIITRKNERTFAYIEQRTARLLSMFQEKNPGTTSEGVDFVVTSHFEGVLDKPLPNWLSVEQRPVTFTPEQLSTMNPKLREVVERQAPRMASFYTYVSEVQ